MAAVPVLSRVQRVFLLQMCGVLQQQRGQLNRRGIGVDGPAIAIFHQTRQPARMVQVRVRQHHVINRLRIDRQRSLVAVAQFVRALKNAAIHQQPFAARFHQILRSGDRARGA